jgi:dTDP-4-dehydrorhamnose reductase
MLVHYSTDYVFDGSAARPYREDDPVAPRSAYGRSKAAGEEAVARIGCRHLIVRASWLYAPWGGNFVLTMLRLLAERREVRVVDDQRGRPTSAEHLAEATARLIGAGATGIHHVCDAGECTWCELAIEIASRGRVPGVVAPCTTAELRRPAPRPAYSVLDLGRTEALIGPMGAWQDHLQTVIDSRRHAPVTGRARDAA